MAPFFEAVLRSNAERRRNKRVVKQLLKVEMHGKLLEMLNVQLKVGRKILKNRDVQVVGIVQLKVVKKQENGNRNQMHCVKQ